MTRATERLVAYERDVVTLLFARDFEPALARLGARADRWRVYRRMARTRLAEVIEDTFSRSRSVLDDRWKGLVERFYDEAPPRSPFIRDIPSEFAAWLLRPESAALLEGVPTWAHDLLRYEGARAEVSFAAEETAARQTHEEAENKGESRDRVVPLAFDRPAVLSPAHRLLHVGWSVHHLPYGELPIDRSRIVEGAATLCLYRDVESHCVEVLELTPFTTALLTEIAREDRPLVEVVKIAAAQAGVAVDESLVLSLSELVEELMRCGVWLGSLASP